MDRGLRDPVPEGQVRCRADEQVEQVIVEKGRRSEQERQKTYGGLDFGVAHQGQIDEVLDGAVPQIAQYSFILRQDLRAGRLRRKNDPEHPQAFQTPGDGLVVFALAE